VLQTFEVLSTKLPSLHEVLLPYTEREGQRAAKHKCTSSQKKIWEQIIEKKQGFNSDAFCMLGQVQALWSKRNKWMCNREIAFIEKGVLDSPPPQSGLWLRWDDINRCVDCVKGNVWQEVVELQNQSAALRWDFLLEDQRLSGTGKSSDFSL
jgi:hypothetical protein